MKLRLFARLILFSFLLGDTVLCDGQVITTVAGNGISGDSGDGGPAIVASLNTPYGGAFDNAGNYYFVEAGSNRIRKISPCGIVSRFAGTGVSGFYGDEGLAIDAKLQTPQWVATDTIGNVYIADVGNYRIRKVDTNGIIHTIAGTGVSMYSGDGVLATTASLLAPAGVFADHFGNIYICDETRIRKIDTGGIIHTIVGNGIVGSTGDGGSADTATIHASRIYVDKFGNLFIVDFLKIRKVDVVTGLINTIGGTGISSLYNGDGISANSANMNPVALAWDSIGNIYIADLGNNRVRKIDTTGIIHTIAGTGIAGFGGDGGLADTATMYDPSGVAFDLCSNLYITCKQNFRIREIIFNSSCNSCDVLSSNNAVNPQVISLYPNPAYNELTITATEKINSVSIYNLIGQTMTFPCLSKGEGTIQIDVSKWPIGVYMVCITDGEGHKTVKRFVKE